MKTILPFRLLLVAFIIFAFTGKAQLVLPYNAEFNNATDLLDWTEYQLVPASYSEWSINSTGGVDGTGFISHDYAPSTADSIADDWYVSPEFNIPNGGTLDSIRFKLSGLSVPEAGDTLGIYLLIGSSDPSLATSKILLYDYRDTTYNADFTWNLITNISLPASVGSCYIGLRYLSQDVSSKWLTIGFDNFAISAISNVGQEELEVNNATIYPNPSSGKIIIESDRFVEAVKVFNGLGAEVYSDELIMEQKYLEIDLSGLDKGIYLVKVNNSTQKIVIL